MSEGKLCDDCESDIEKDVCSEDCNCKECRDEREAAKDREFDERSALGYL